MTGCLRNTADPMLSILVREVRILLQRLLHPQLVWEGKRPDRFFPEPWNSQKKTSNPYGEKKAVSTSFGNA